MKEIIVATKNNGKAKEFQDFFAQFNIKCYSLSDLDQDYPDVEETGKTFEENAIIKAEAAAKFFNKPVIADDSGLVIDALGGKPGVETARFAGEDKNDDANMDKVLMLLKGTKESERSARFVAALAIKVPGEKTLVKEGYCEGRIAFEKKGSEGFGYDPIFIPEGYNVTMAQLAKEEKNSISHRSNAFKQLKHVLTT